MSKIESKIKFTGNGKYHVFVLRDNELLHFSEHRLHDDAKRARSSALHKLYYRLNINEKRHRQYLANKKYLERQKRLCPDCQRGKITKYAKLCKGCASIKSRKK